MGILGVIARVDVFVQRTDFGRRKFILLMVGNDAIVSVRCLDMS